MLSAPNHNQVSERSSPVISWKLLSVPTYFVFPTPMHVRGHVVIMFHLAHLIYAPWKDPLPACSVAQWSLFAIPGLSSLPGSSVHEISQARILEWVAISFSRGYLGPRDQTQASGIESRVFTVWATRESHTMVWQCMKVLCKCSLGFGGLLSSKQSFGGE